MRGLFKLSSSNNVDPDGDIYAHDGTVTRNYEYRAYESGDESLSDTITDGSHTVVKLTTTTTESADPFTDPMKCDNWGTEEFVDTRTVPVPVGHNTKYQPDLKAKVEVMPNSPDADGLYLMERKNDINTYTAFPSLPSSNGTYTLKCTVSGSTKTMSWEADAE